MLTWLCARVCVCVCAHMCEHMLTTVSLHVHRGQLELLTECHVFAQKNIAKGTDAAL